jgi:hypothetical protein
MYNLEAVCIYQLTSRPRGIFCDEDYTVPTLYKQYKCGVYITFRYLSFSSIKFLVKAWSSADISYTAFIGFMISMVDTYIFFLQNILSHFCKFIFSRYSHDYTLDLQKTFYIFFVKNNTTIKDDR